MATLAIFWALAYLEREAYLKPFATLAMHIQNPAKGHYSAIFSHIQKPCHIYENLRIFRALTYLKPDINLEPCQRFKIEFFAKIFKNYNHFSKVLHLRSLAGFWIGLFLNKYSLTCRVSDLEPCNSCIFRSLPYSEFCHIKTQDIFRTLSRHILAYSERYVTLAYWEPCHIQKF